MRFITFDSIKPDLPSLPHEWTVSSEQVLTCQQKDVAVNAIGAISDFVRRRPFQLVSRLDVARLLGSLRKPPPVPLRPFPQDNVASGCASEKEDLLGLPVCSWSAFNNAFPFSRREGASIFFWT